MANFMHRLKRLGLESLAICTVSGSLYGCAADDTPKKTTRAQPRFDYSAKPNLTSRIENYTHVVEFWGEVSPTDAYISDKNIELMLYMTINADKKNPIILYKGIGKVEIKKDKTGKITSQRIYPVGYEFDPVDFYNRINVKNGKIGRLHCFIDPDNKFEETNEEDNSASLPTFQKDQFDEALKSMEILINPIDIIIKIEENLKGF